jgi:ApaG protein
MYRATTNQIQVTVMPHYLEEHSKPDKNQYFWSYTIGIANLGDTPVQLLSRYWKITDALGRVSEVRGEGVVGKQPLIGPSQRFEYTSGCPLETPQGFMEGHYAMLDHNGLIFEIEVPAFSLDSPYEKRILN